MQRHGRHQIHFLFSLLSKADLFSHLFLLSSWCVLSPDSATKNQSRSLPVWKTARPPSLKIKKKVWGRSSGAEPESSGIRGISSIPDLKKRRGTYSNHFLLKPFVSLLSSKTCAAFRESALHGKVILSIGLWSSLYLPSGNPSGSRVPHVPCAHFKGRSAKLIAECVTLPRARQTPE